MPVCLLSFSVLSCSLYQLSLMLPSQRSSLKYGSPRAAGGWFSFLPIILIIVIFYFLLIRPQQRQQKEAKKREASLTPGQKVVTIGGIHGIVREVLANDVRVELAPNVVVKFAKAAIAQILTKNEEGDKESK